MYAENTCVIQRKLNLTGLWKILYLWCFIFSAAICTPACQNNGHCGARDGRPICVCPHNFAGDYCETRKFVFFSVRFCFCVGCCLVVAYMHSYIDSFGYFGWIEEMTLTLLIKDVNWNPNDISIRFQTTCTTFKKNCM